MQRRDLRMGQIAAIKSASDRRQAHNLRTELDRQAVALAKIAIQIVYWTQSPLVKAPQTRIPVQQRDLAYKQTVLGAEYSRARRLGQAESSSH